MAIFVLTLCIFVDIDMGAWELGSMKMHYFMPKYNWKMSHYYYLHCIVQATDKHSFSYFCNVKKILLGTHK